MSLTYKKYIDNVDYAWYKSSNILYSECYDKKDDLKSLKIVFKGGRTYLYENVDVNNYIAFRNAVSQGTALRDFILSSNCIRLPDTQEKEIDDRLQFFLNETKINEKENDACYVINKNFTTNEITLLLNNKPLFKGIDGEINIVELFNSMALFYKINNIGELKHE